MKLRPLAITALALGLALAAAAPASADAAKPGQSMTHMKTAPGLASTLESAGVVLYVQGGATAAVIGDSISAPNGQGVFHIPVTGTKGGVRDAGRNLVFFNTSNNQQVQLRNPVIDLRKGQVIATIPQGSGTPTPVLTITNAKSLKPKATTDRSTGIRSTTYTGAQLAIAPGIGAALESLLGLPAGSLPDGTSFGSADVTLNAKAAR